MKLTGDELVKIIKSCKFAKVTMLKIGDTVISFETQTSLEKTTKNEKVNIESPVEDGEDLDKKNQMPLPFGEVPPAPDNIQDELEQFTLHITNPGAWEEQQLSKTEG